MRKSHMTILAIWLSILFFGCVPEDEETFGPTLPTSRDLRSDGLLTPVKNQMNLGSCWAFATAGLAEYHYKKDFNIEIDISEQHMVNCAGFGPQDGLNFLKDHGAVTEEDLPYQDAVLDCDNSLDGIYKIKSYQMMDISKKSFQERIEFLKMTILNEGPFVTHLDLFDDLGTYQSGIYEYNGTANSAGGHIVIVVGYVDDESVKNGGYWICKNSWGPEWGEDGYFRIPYDECNIAIYYAITISATYKSGTIEKLTYIPESGYHLRWAKNGEKIAYTRRYPNSVGIWVYDFSTQQEVQVVKDMEGDMQLSWLDEGDNIVFDAYGSSGRLDLWTINIDTEEKRKIIDQALVPDAHHSQNKLVCSKGTNINIYRKNGEFVSTVPNISGGMASFSPDGNKLVLVSEESGNEDIWIINTDGTEKKKITNYEGRDYWPRWSPDGKMIAYESNQTGNGDIYLYNIETEQHTQLTDSPGRDGMGDWSPDGKSILFCSDRNCDWGVYIYWDIF